MKYRFAIVFFMLASVGCGKSPTEQGEVTGTVSYQGKPLPGGSISFLSERGFQSSAVISPEGHFRIKSVVGPCKVTIDNRMLSKDQRNRGPRLKSSPPGTTAPATVEGTYVPLPDKYLSFEKSGLTCEVQKGSQTRDFPLDPT